ncbi:hypothetical protein sscle_03g028520 [Sclerotinia sclerotiorum 1980 UF-70]|nr:hypothetical protein sscle_03g028520 [Sclerotinia sclerotiorum 1980 UF-70]
MGKEYTQEDILTREQNFRVFLNGIKFWNPTKSQLELQAFKNECVAAYVGNKNCSDPDAFIPSRARIQRIIDDRRKLDSNPNASIEKPESFPGPAPTWKHRVRNNYRVDGQSVSVKCGESWEELTPFEECFALFIECHIPREKDARHRGRDTTYGIISAGEQGLGFQSTKRKAGANPQLLLAPVPPALVPPALVPPALVPPALVPPAPAAFGPVPNIPVPDVPSPQHEDRYDRVPQVQVQGPYAAAPLNPPPFDQPPFHPANPDPASTSAFVALANWDEFFGAPDTSFS